MCNNTKFNYMIICIAEEFATAMLKLQQAENTSDLMSNAISEKETSYSVNRKPKGKKRYLSTKCEYNIFYAKKTVVSGPKFNATMLSFQIIIFLFE